MADLMFGQFPAGGAAQTADIVPIERGSLNYRLTVSAIAAFVNANLSAVKSLSNGTDTLSGAVQLIAGANITIAKTAANTFTLSSTGGGGGNVDSVNGKTGTVTLNTDDIPEGSTNKYLNQTALAAKYDKTGGTISGDVLVSRDENAGTVAIFVNNSNNTSGDSDAQIKITTAGANAGDPYATFTAYGVADWSAGFNNQSGNFEIARANNLGNNTCLTIDGNNDVDIPSGTLSVSRDPVSAKEVATKAYIDSRSYDEGVNLLEIDADVTLTEISALLPVSPSVDGLKVLLPTMNYIRQKLSVGQTFQVLNVDFNSNSFDICYADGTVIKTLKAREMFEIMIQKNTTQGQDLYPYPKTLFILSETRGELGGLIILQPDDFYDDPDGNAHLVPSGGQAGQILQSNGSGALPTFADLTETGTFVPVDASGAGLAFTTALGFYAVIGKMVFITMTVGYPTQSQGNSAKIGGLPFAMSNSVQPAPVGFGMVYAGATSFLPVGFKGDNGDTVLYPSINDKPSANSDFSGLSFTMSMTYIRD